MLTVDAGHPLGPVAPLHGVNLGPVDRHWGRNYADAFRRVGIPSVRLHDASLGQGEIVDLHCVFPDPKADPDDPASYVFELTDHYLAAIRDAGAEIYFRLGESIEHEPVKTFIRPERWTPERMARVCSNIVRHYNHGWANGHEWAIKYWEFWNEPENRWDGPPGGRLCWTGTADEFFDFYRAAATEIKDASPEVSLGLAGFTGRAPGRGGYTEGWLAADPDDRDGYAGWLGLIPRCVEAGLPVDFVSWHLYCGSWSLIEETALGIRRRLDVLGLEHAESHLTEWNYVPTLRDDEGEFTYMNARRKGDYERYEIAEAVMNGAEGAAFMFGVLSLLQDAHVDLTHFYTGVAEPWGLFRTSGRPMAKYSALEAFSEFLTDGGQRVPITSDEDERTRGLAVVCGDRLKVGVASLARDLAPLRVDLSGLPGGVSVESARRLGPNGWEPIEVTVEGGALSGSGGEPGITIVDLAR